MRTPEVRFSDWIERGFELFKAHAGLLIVVNLLAAIISLLTLGILAGPMSAGVVLVTLALLDRREPKPEAGMVFKGFDFFLPSFLFFLVFTVGLVLAGFLLSSIPCLGSLLSLALSLAVATFTAFGQFLIVDRKMDFWAAATASYNMIKGNFWPFLGFVVVLSLIVQVGAMLCCVGLLVTLPLYWCMLAVAFRDVFGTPEKAAVEPAPEAPPAS